MALAPVGDAEVVMGVGELIVELQRLLVEADGLVYLALLESDVTEVGQRPEVLRIDLEGSREASSRLVELAEVDLRRSSLRQSVGFEPRIRQSFQTFD